MTKYPPKPLQLTLFEETTRQDFSVLASRPNGALGAQVGDLE